MQWPDQGHRASNWQGQPQSGSGFMPSYEHWAEVWLGVQGEDQDACLENMKSHLSPQGGRGIGKSVVGGLSLCQGISIEEIAQIISNERHLPQKVLCLQGSEGLL